MFDESGKDITAELCVVEIHVEVTAMEMTKATLICFPSQVTAQVEDKNVKIETEPLPSDVVPGDPEAVLDQFKVK